MAGSYAPPWSDESRFDEFFEESMAEVDSVARRFDETLEVTFAGLDASLPRQPGDAAAVLGRVQAELGTRANEMRRGFRSMLVSALPARRGSDRPTLGDLERILPLQGIDLGTPATELSTSRLTRAILLCGLIGAGVAAAVSGVQPSYWQLAGALTGAVLGAILISLIIPRWVRIAFIGLGLLAATWVGIFVSERGWEVAQEELRRPGGWVFRSAALAAALGIVAVIRISAKRRTASRGMLALGARVSARFRERLLSDARFLSLLAATGTASLDGETDEDASGRTADAVAVECALFLSAPGGSDPEKTIRKIAGLVGAASPAEGVEATVFMWDGSPEQLETYRLRGLVSVGQMVRVTRSPIYREDEEGVRSVAQPGEVVREGSRP